MVIKLLINIPIVDDWNECSNLKLIYRQKIIITHYYKTNLDNAPPSL